MHTHHQERDKTPSISMAAFLLFALVVSLMLIEQHRKQTTLQRVRTSVRTIRAKTKNHDILPLFQY
jgi:hypothetical protein